jgi:hypothetical protein
VINCSPRSAWTKSPTFDVTWKLIDIATENLTFYRFPVAMSIIFQVASEGGDLVQAERREQFIAQRLSKSGC